MVGSPDAPGSLPPSIAALPFLFTNAEPFLLQRLPPLEFPPTVLLLLVCAWSSHWDVPLFAAAGPGVPSCTLGSVPCGNCLSTSCTMCHLSFGYTVVSTPLVPSSDGRAISQHWFLLWTPLHVQPLLGPAMDPATFFSLDLTRIRIRLFSSSKHQCQFDTILRAPHLREDVLRLPQLRLGPVLLTCSQSSSWTAVPPWTARVNHSRLCIIHRLRRLCLFRSSHVNCSQHHLGLNSHASLSLFGCLNVALMTPPTWDELAVPSTSVICCSFHNVIRCSFDSVIFTLCVVRTVCTSYVRCSVCSVGLPCTSPPLDPMALELVAWSLDLSGVVRVPVLDDVVSLVWRTAPSILVGSTASTCCEFLSFAPTVGGGVSTSPCGASADPPRAIRAGGSLMLKTLSCRDVDIVTHI